MKECINYLWIVFSIASVQCNGLQIKAAVKVDSRDDVSFEHAINVCSQRGDRSILTAMSAQCHSHLDQHQESQRE